MHCMSIATFLACFDIVTSAHVIGAVGKVEFEGPAGLLHACIERERARAQEEDDNGFGPGPRQQGGTRFHVAGRLRGRVASTTTGRMGMHGSMRRRAAGPCPQGKYAGRRYRWGRGVMMCKQKKQPSTEGIQVEGKLRRALKTNLARARASKG